MISASMRFLFCAALLILTAVPAFAGQKLAEEYCSRCHAIGESGDSPLAAAPPFREIAKRYPAENLAESLAEGITTGHADMPEFVFSVEEIGRLIAYFEQLAKK